MQKLLYLNHVTHHRVDQTVIVELLTDKRFAAAFLATEENHLHVDPSVL